MNFKLLLLIFIISIAFFGYSLKEKYVNYRDPDIIKKVLDIDNYDSEKKRISLTNIQQPKRYLRYFLDENRDNFIKDIPFSPHIILKSYDDVDIAKFINTSNNLNKINVLDDYDSKTLENKNDYCSRHKHKKECILAERKYKCFGKLEFSKKECEAQTDIIGNRVKPGIWDRRCVNNMECPFYRANKNYPNNFGGCNQNGYCEFPKGIKRLSYRKYVSSSIPLCYNCKNKQGRKEIGNCCHLQKYPDYLFNNDLGERFKYSEELRNKGLSTINHDDYRTQFRKLEKKLKI